jgi:thiamine pyrophosphate-dependent acetolactate synthase large subunit-like protein
MRYEGEVRVAAAMKQLVARAFQFARSDPKGPVYLIGAREIMEAPRRGEDRSRTLEALLRPEPCRPLT